MSDRTPMPAAAALDEQDPLQQQLAAYALGALDPGEEDAIEAYLSESAEGRALLREYDEILRLMPYGLAPAQPSPGTRSLLIARAQLRREAAAAQEPPRWWQQRRAQVATLAVAAVLAVVLATGLIVNNLRNDPDDTEETTTTEAVLEEMSNDPASMVVRMEADANLPRAGANLVVNDARDAAGIIAWNLPVQEYDRCYQLWFEHEDGTRVSGGTFWVDEGGDAMAMVSLPSNFDTIALIDVTDEPMGGSSTPTGPDIISAHLE